MAGPTGILANEGAGGSSLAGAGKAAIDFKNAFGFQGWTDDQFFFAPILAGQIHPVSTRGQAESFYKYLAPLSRGHVVPNGYPTNDALYTLADFFPIIQGMQPGDPKTIKLKWQYPRFMIKGRKILPPTVMTLADFMADKFTSVSAKDSKGNPCEWYSRTWRVFASFTPHKTFNRLYLAKQIFADPASQFWQLYNQGWKEETFLEGVRDLAIMVVAALALVYVGAEYMAASAGSAGAGATGGVAAADGTSGAVSSNLAVTDVSVAAPTGETATTVSTTTFTSSTLAPITAAPGAAGSGAAIAGGGLTATDVVASTGVAKAASTVLGAVKSVAGGAAKVLTAGKAKTKAAKTKTTGGSGPSVVVDNVSGGSISPIEALGGIALALIAFTIG